MTGSVTSSRIVVDLLVVGDFSVEGSVDGFGVLSDGLVGGFGVLSPQASNISFICKIKDVCRLYNSILSHIKVLNFLFLLSIITLTLYCAINL